MEPLVLQMERDFLLCIKPAGLVSESPDMPKKLQSLVGGEIFPVHRLDKAASGLMVYARTKAAAAALSKAVAERKIEKDYLAVVHGSPTEPRADLRDLLFFDRRKNKAFAVRRARKGVKEALLSYELLAEKDGLSLLKIRLHTGRSHQIRAQFASRKLPLVGDRRYGSPCDVPLALWAYRLAFPYPTDGNSIEKRALPETLGGWERRELEALLC